jgi:MSHA biogenesis protein MshK
MKAGVLRTKRREDAARAAAASAMAALFLMLGPDVARAQADPMRPPAGIDSGPLEVEAGDGGGTRLQSVMISPSGRAAIINGIVVRQGEKYGDAVLLTVEETEVVLKRGSESQVLKLYPAVEKRAAQAKGAARKGKAGASSR